MRGHRLGLLVVLLVGLGPAAVAQSSFISVSPAGHTVVNGYVQVTIAWCSYGTGNDRFDINTRTVYANGVDITSDFDLLWSPSACGHEGPIADEELWVSTGMVPVDSMTGEVYVLADASNSNNYHWQGYENYRPPPPRRVVTVIAEQANMAADSASARSERFTLTNDGNTVATYQIVLTGCSSGAISTACTRVPSGNVTVNSGNSAVVTVSYTAGGTVGQVGAVTLTATDSASAYGGGTAVVGSARTRVTVAGLPAVGVSIVGTAPGANDMVARGACVTVALAPATASECGDLRLAHAVAPVLTMGTARAPTLLYNSQHARPVPTVLAEVRLAAGTLPTTVTACIKVAGSNRGCRSWAGSNWGTAGSTRRIAVQGDTNTWSTGRVNYTLEVTTTGGTSQGPYTATGRLYIVNRSTSRYGAGWWIAGLEQLQVVHADTLVWIGGDGSVKRYLKTGSVWKPSNFAAADSVITNGTGYARLTAEHARVFFNSAGRHDSTRNSLRHVTRFEYGGSTDSLVKIRVPRPNGAYADFTFAYASGTLDSVASPGGRGTRLFVSSAKVDSIRDPDGSSVRLAYGSGLNAKVVTQRRNRLNVAASFTFTFDSGHRVIRATRVLGDTLRIAPSETRGLLAPVHRDSAFTEINGPRTDVADVSRFWSNGFGAPTRMRNAVGMESVVRYASTWPGVVDSAYSPAWVASRSYLNARGLPDSVKVFHPFGSSADTAITRYGWHATLNRPVSVRTRTAGTSYVVDSLSYGSDSTLSWQQRGTGAAPTRVSYSYTSPDRLPAAVALPVAGSITFAYDTLGNLRQETSPEGFVTLTVRDAVGRPDTVWTPRVAVGDSSDSEALLRITGVRTIAKYDKMGRDTMTVTRGPRVKLANTRVVPADTIRLRKLYDAEGRLLTLSRLYSRNSDTISGALYAMNDSQWEYDSLGRLKRKQEAGSGGWTTYTYDRAGNLTATATPNGASLVSKYDALNRLTRQIVPPVTFDSVPCQFYQTPLDVYPEPVCRNWFPTAERSAVGAALCIAVDTAFFRYDAHGNLAVAENHWAIVARAFAPNGAMTSETQKIRFYNTWFPAACGGGDKRSMALGDGHDSYLMQYGYDLAGRRTTLTLPDGHDPCSGACVQRYKYNSVTGTLDTLVHPKANGDTLVTRFVYDAQGRLTDTHHPGGIVSSSGYDLDGRIVGRNGPLNSETLVYDAAGRVTGGDVAAGTLGISYNGLGALIHAQGITPELTAEELKVDALGSRLWIRDIELVDGVDRSRTNTIDTATGHLTGVGLASTPSPSTYRYTSAQEYDANGNVVHTWEHENDPVGTAILWHLREERSYYAADNKLTYFNRSIGWMLEPSQKNGTFDEYRYDALGRRVLTRSRRVDDCAGACDEYVERTIFDGDQVLLEIRSETKPINPGGNGDLFGTVIYAHAGGIDRPVHVLKKTPVWYGGAGGWGSVTPHADWRGEYAIGTYANGDPCVSIGPTCPEWTGNTVSAFGEPEEAGPPTGHAIWVGNLLRGRRDPSGMTYLRNRYYDANTGRFTQQDPIGLAGGLNLYGYANGDPINFADPFGLSADTTKQAAQQQQSTQSCGRVLTQPGVINSANRVWRQHVNDPTGREFAESLLRTGSGRLYGVRVNGYVSQTQTSAQYVGVPGQVGGLHSHPAGGREGLWGDWSSSIADPKGGGIKIVVTEDSLFLLPNYPALSFPAAVTEACARRNP